MIGTWIISDNHIALMYDEQILHPDSEEVYMVIGNEGESFVADIPCKKLEESFPKIHFSKIGSPIRCEIENSNDDIKMRLYVERKGRRIGVDIIEGEIIDQCVAEDEWFYVSGSNCK